MSPRDILSPALAQEKRVKTTAPVLRRVFTNEMYDVFVGLYPGGLLTTLVHYKNENLRIMNRLGEAPVIPAGQDRDAWVRAAVALLQSSGRGPFHLIRDAKLDCGITLSLHDRAALRLAGIEVPRSAGRFRETFKDQ
jgi:hypothetical protein